MKLRQFPGLMLIIFILSACSSNKTESDIRAETNESIIDQTEEQIIDDSFEEDSNSDDKKQNTEGISEEQLTDDDLYNSFLRDEEAAIFHAEADLGDYVKLSGLQDVEKYTLFEIVRAIFDYLNEGHEDIAYLESIKYAYIDCGDDGNKELALWIYMPYKKIEFWNDCLILKAINGEINICYAQDFWSRSNLKINEYGFIKWDGSGGAAHHVYQDSVVDAEGNLNFLYRMDSADWSEYISTPDIEENDISDKSNDIIVFNFNFDDNDDEGNVTTYALRKDWINEENNKRVSFYDYDIRYDESLYTEDNSIRKAIQNTGKEVYSVDEILDRISEKLSLCNLDEKIINGEEAQWQYLNIPGSLLELMPEKDNIFALNREFPMEMYFSSGAGGWATSISIEKDGSFVGEFRDSDMGVSGEGYDATEYICEFSGKFGNIQKINEYTYSMELIELIPKQYPEGVWIEEVEGGAKVKYIASMPYGLDDGGKTYYLYLPSTPVEGLNETFLSWVHVYSDSQYLDHYCIYDADGQENYGFSEW